MSGVGVGRVDAKIKASSSQQRFLVVIFRRREKHNIKIKTNNKHTNLMEVPIICLPVANMSKHAVVSSLRCVYERWTSAPKNACFQVWLWRFCLACFGVLIFQGGSTTKLRSWRNGRRRT